MHRIELHSVTVIGCAQNKAKYCTQLCTATAPHVPTFLKQFRFYFEYYEILYASITMPRLLDCYGEGHKH